MSKSADNEINEQSDNTNHNQLLSDLLSAQLAREHGYMGTTGEEVADELDAIIAAMKD